MDLFYVLLVLLVATRVFGELATRIKQPQLVGELMAGITVGVIAQQFSSHLPTLAELPDNAVFEVVTDLGAFFLMLVAGVEMRPKDLVRRSGTALPIAVSGIAVPLALGFAISFLLLPDSDKLLAQASVVGLTLAVTAVPVSVTVLMELGALNTRTGNIIVGAAVFDDVLSLLLLAVVVSVVIHGEALSASAIALLALKMLSFFIILVMLGRLVLPRSGRLIRRFRMEHVEISLLIVWGLLSAVLSESLGMHFVVGAFAAGVMFTRHTIDEQSYRSIRSHLENFTFGFLAPLFFASIGLQMKVGAIVQVPVLSLTMILAAFAGKFIGAGGVARVFGLTRLESIAVGAGMNARGAVALIVAGIALEAGVFDSSGAQSAAVSNLFSVLVITAIATTMISPVLLRYVIRRGNIR